MGLGTPSTARALMRSFAETILQSVLKFTPPLALVALWHETQFVCINVLTAANFGPSARLATEMPVNTPVQPFASLTDT